jgi:hypothetical protein
MSQTGQHEVGVLMMMYRGIAPVNLWHWSQEGFCANRNLERTCKNLFVCSDAHMTNSCSAKSLRLAFASEEG